MTCSPSIVALMHKYLDEELNTNEEVELRSHLQKCEECQKHFHDLKKAIALVQSSNHIHAPSNFTEKVMGNLPKEKRRVGYKRWLQAHPMLTAAAMFVILMLGSLLTFWTEDQHLSVSKQSNLQIQDNTVIVPAGEVVKGDVVVRNGNIQIEGEVQGDVVVINGEKYVASAGKVTGDLHEINAIFEWLWYKIKDISKNIINLVNIEK